MKKYKFTLNGGNYDVVIKGIDGDVAEMEVNGSSYSVKINEELKVSKTPTLVRKEVQTKPGVNRVAEKLAPMPIGARPSSRGLNSPLPGNILKVNVSEGSEFKEGDVLMVMESMKMENNVLAERNGTVSKVNVQVGQAVLQNDILLEFV